MNRAFALVLAFGCMTFGCYTRSEYEADLARAQCEKSQECAGEAWPFESVDACVAEEEEEDEAAEEEGAVDACTYDAGEAKSCVEEYEALTCEDLQEGAWPDSCDAACGT